MLPYTDLPYFIVILLVAIPAMLLGVTERSRRRWILGATALMALVHFGPSQLWAGAVSELLLAGTYAVFQLGLVKAFVRQRARRRSSFVFAGVIGLAITPLVITKVTTVATPDSVIGFLGISYVTFRAVDTLIVIQDGLVTAVPAGAYLAFLFFPATVSAGPIDRYRRFTADYQSNPDRATFLANVDLGVAYLFRGLLYKFVVAALIQDVLITRIEARSGATATLAYMYAYSFYLFFDFAGYSALAIGVSRFFGVRTPDNFDRPFIAANIAEFWNRWHISLSSWFRDHVYMRFVMAAAKGRWFGGDRFLASYLGFAVTFGLMGAWHGLEGRYLVYGGYHAALLIGHHLLGRWIRRWPTLIKSRAWNLLAIAATFHAVCFGFLIFSGRLG